MIRGPTPSYLKLRGKPVFQVSLELAVAALLCRVPFLKASSLSLVCDFYCCLLRGCLGGGPGSMGRGLLVGNNGGCDRSWSIAKS